VSLAAFLERVVEVLDEAKVSYMLTGSLASAFYAVPRATQDIDVVIEAQEEGIDRLVQGLLGAGWYADREAAMEAWRGQSQFNAIEPETGWKADFIVRKDRPYSREEFSRRERISLLGVELAIASLEDVLIAKLEWSHLGDSALQRRDVAQLLERTWQRVDHAYVEKWVRALGLEAEWRAALAEAKPREKSGDTE
jgi:predicted nucleotidyltransferase